MTNGLLQPKSGTILVEGQPIAGRKRYCGYMPQKDLLFPWRTVGENVALPLEIQGGLSKAERRDRAEAALADVGLAGCLDKMPDELSGGMRQRAMIAMGMSCNPDLLICDEPTTLWTSPFRPRCWSSPLPRRWKSTICLTPCPSSSPGPFRRSTASSLPPEAALHHVSDETAGRARTKSANVVGQTMKLNPHGDAAIYDTLVRLSRGYGALLHPLVDSKGNFGKVYSRDMAWAASRYTEVQLDPICAELFRDIDQDTVDFVDNYDGKLKEPTLLPTTFPTCWSPPTRHRRWHGQQPVRLQPGGGVRHHHRLSEGPGPRSHVHPEAPTCHRR